MYLYWYYLFCFLVSDSCRDILIEVGQINYPTESFHLCALREGQVAGIEKINCQLPIQGRYVKISSDSSSGLALYEIEIIGHWISINGSILL
mgnify:FL=1